MNRFLAFAFACLGATLSTPVSAETHLGSVMVRYNTDTDVIPVPSAVFYGAVRFCVSQSAVHMHDLDAHFANGGHQDLWVRAVVRAGECTRWIDLNGPRRNLTSIVLRYDTIGASGPRAVVSAYGR